MWSWHRGDYLIPKIDRWAFYETVAILPVEDCDDIMRITMFEIQGNMCKNYKAITKNGLEDLCGFCKHNIDRFIDPKLICSYKPDVKMSMYGWHEDDINALTNSMELPIYAILPQPDRSKLDIKRMSFSPGRIIQNMRWLHENADTFFLAHKNDAAMNFYTSRTMTTRPNNIDVWKTKIKFTYKKLQAMNQAELKKKMSVMAI